MARNTVTPKGDYGTPIKFDPNFKGPIHRRSCTDIICLLIFLVFIAGWIAVSSYAITQGDVNRLLVPADTEGRKCGLDTGVEDKKYLVFFDMVKCLSPSVPLNGCPTPQVCVKECPRENLLYKQIETGIGIGSVDEVKRKIVCKYDVDINGISSLRDIIRLMDDNKCAKNIFNSQAISLRCIPKEITDVMSIPGVADVKESSQKLMDNMISLTKLNEMGSMIIEDLVNARWWIVLGLFFVMLICLIYISLMRWIAGPMVWFSTIAIMALLSYAIYLCEQKYVYYRDNPVILEPSQTNLKAWFDSVSAMKETWLVLMIIACIVLAIILLSVIFLRKRIVIAIALIKEGSKAVGSVKSTLMFPIFPWIFQVGVLALAIVVTLYLTTIGESNFKATGLNNATCCDYKDGDSCTPQEFNQACGSCRPDAICHFVSITNPPIVDWFHAYNVVAFFWVVFFIQGLGEMILAGTFATWYWTFKKSDVPFFTLTNSIARTCIFNLGTIAFGALIITICRLIRVLLEYVDQQTKKYDNPVSRCIMCCCKCFFACLESFLRFINKNAYIMCAVHGKAFFPSARDAFSLLMRNILRVFVLDKVTDFLFFLSKLVVAVGCGVIAYFALRDPQLYDLAAEQRLNYDLVPALIIGVAAYLIACVFFGVYSMAVDTLFLCFLEDCERNDGTPEKPYFMSKQLMKILGKRNKFD